MVPSTLLSRSLAISFFSLLLGPFGAALAQNGTAELPVTRVVLFTSGVGYFEHSGTVSGDQQIELAVATDQMDDLLQSLVLQDFDGGTIEPVRYDASDPLGRILASYSLDLSRAPTLADLLQQARGEPLTVEAGRTLEGTLLSVERVPGPDSTFTVFLTLATAGGLMRVSLDEVSYIRFNRAEVQAELDAALAAIARQRSTDETTVRLRFSGDGERRVQVGYIREMPVWKTSYRLVLGDDGSADLQGWAIFDNPTNLDLEGVAVSFVAGQPISFITGLYQPVYVARPRVAVATATTTVPDTDFGDFAPEPVLEAEAGIAGFARNQPAPAADAPQLQGAGVVAQAEGARTGATFEYRVREPVSVGRYQSAMIPIVQQTVPAPQLSWYSAGSSGLHPLRAVRLVNDTDLHLAAGTVTLFGAGGFTGNARLSDLVPGDDRLLAYAVDLDVSILQDGDIEPQEITAVRLQNGLLEISLRQRQHTRYRIEIGSDEARFLVVEHPKVPGFELISPGPAPAETERSYRFGVAVGEVDDDDTLPTQLRCPADGEGCTLELVLERITSERIGLTNLGGEQIASYLENFELSDIDRAVLAVLRDLKLQAVSLDRSIAQRQNRLAEIEREQNRIRQNMNSLDRNSELYRRYVSDLGAQEDEIDEHQLALTQLRRERLDLQQQVDDLILALVAPSGE